MGCGLARASGSCSSYFHSLIILYDSSMYSYARAEIIGAILMATVYVELVCVGG